MRPFYISQQNVNESLQDFSQTIQTTNNAELLDECVANINKVFVEGDYSNTTNEDAQLILDWRARRYLHPPRRRRRIGG